MTPRGPDVYQQAMRTALRLLRGRDLTEAEIFTRLLTKGFGEIESKAVVSSLLRQGYVSDARIVDRAVEKAVSDRPTGRLRLEMELKARGAKDAAIEHALVSVSPEQERAIAEREVRRIQSKGGSVSKAGTFLARRGFDTDTIETVLETIYGSEP